jgi:hypothetical protein
MSNLNPETIKKLHIAIDALNDAQSALSDAYAKVDDAIDAANEEIAGAEEGETLPSFEPPYDALKAIIDLEDRLAGALIEHSATAFVLVSALNERGDDTSYKLFSVSAELQRTVSTGSDGSDDFGIRINPLDPTIAHLTDYAADTQIQLKVDGPSKMSGSLTFLVISAADRTSLCQKTSGRQRVIL